jgi:hypothetical protein
MSLSPIWGEEEFLNILGILEPWRIASASPGRVCWGTRPTMLFLKKSKPAIFGDASHVLEKKK